MKNTQKTVFKVSDFLSWQRAGSLVLSPNFQRRPVWPTGAKSLLIDSVVRGIPVPIIFLRERTDLKTLEAEREVVDGQQRLRTIISFIAPETLVDFNDQRDGFTVDVVHNKEIAGKRFRELPPSVRQQILDYDFSVHVLPSDTEDRDVLQIFGRMNSTGFKLNEQELRNAEFFGAFKELMYKLAYEQLDRWRKWCVFTEIDIARMIEVEETSDSIITMFEGEHGKKQKLISAYYGKYNSKFPEKEEIAKRFRASLDEIERQLGKELSSSVFRRKPLFHTLFSFYYDLMFGLKSSLKRAKPKAVPRDAGEAARLASLAISAGEIPEDLAKVLRGATGHLPSRQRRLKFLQDTYRRVRSH